MGLLDALLGAARGAPQTSPREGGLGPLGALLGGQNQQLLTAVLGMLLSGGGRQGGGQGGGLADVLGQLRGAGLGRQVDSWVSTGDNIPVSASQLQDGLGGGDLLGALARQLGMSQGDAASALSQVLPGVVDQLTPRGEMPEELPDASQVDLGEVVGRMLQGR